jgi:23S rRNA pseudouridine1911/1915/1917 synthase
MAVANFMTHAGMRVAHSEWQIEPALAGTRLDDFLVTAGGLASRRRVRWAIERGKIVLNDRDVLPAEAARTLVLGDRLRLWLDRPGTARQRVRRADGTGRQMRVVYEDGAVLVVHKPAGLLTVPLPRRPDADSVEAQLRVHLRSKGKHRPLVVHRIDRDTSGLVVFATHAEAQHRLKAQFERREPERVYTAIVTGVPDPPAGVWRDHLIWDRHALVQRPARSDDPRATACQCQYRTVETFAGAAWLEVRLVTGRRNQIRVQAALRGHPLLGERLYNHRGERPAEGTDPAVRAERQALHASRLSFTHPQTGRMLSFDADLPPDLEGLLARLRGAAGSGSSSD